MRVKVLLLLCKAFRKVAVQRSMNKYIIITIVGLIFINELLLGL